MIQIDGRVYCIYNACIHSICNCSIIIQKVNDYMALLLRSGNCPVHASSRHRCVPILQPIIIVPSNYLQSFHRLVKERSWIKSSRSLTNGLKNSTCNRTCICRYATAHAHMHMPICKYTCTHQSIHYPYTWIYRCTIYIQSTCTHMYAIRNKHMRAHSAERMQCM